METISTSIILLLDHSLVMTRIGVSYLRLSSQIGRHPIAIPDRSHAVRLGRLQNLCLPKTRSIMATHHRKVTTADHLQMLRIGDDDLPGKEHLRQAYTSTLMPLLSIVQSTGLPPN